MNLTDEEILELHDLLNGLVERNLPPIKLKRLENWILESPIVRREYVSFMDMSSSLSHYAEEIVSDEDEISDEDCEQENKTIKFFRPFLGIAALFILSLTLFNFMSHNFSEQDGEIFSKEKGIQVVNDFSSTEKSVFAVLTKTVGLEWSNDSSYRPVLGQTLENGILNVSEGLAQIEFIQGATVILEGPAVFEITGTNTGVLTQGKLRANVPPVAKGFAVDLPRGNLVDLGTEFGLNVHDGGSTEIFVYKGKIKYDGLSTSNESYTREVSTGEALFIDPYGYPNWIEMPSESFLGAAELAFISMEQSQTRYSSWIALSEEIAGLDETLLYYSFDNHSPWSRTLNDLSRNSNGAVVGCKWTDGRWAGKSALDFTNKNDQVRLELPTQHLAITLGAWIKLDKLNEYPVPIISSDSNTNGAVSWFINPDGKLVLQITKDGTPVRYESAVAFHKNRLGRWMHIATTFNHETQLVSHYVNGRSFSREKITNIIPVSFGPCLLGNFSKKSFIKKRRSMQGKIDEFVLFDQAYEEAGIRRLYEIGCPYEIPTAFGSSTP
jgi:hypothetical protein